MIILDDIREKSRSFWEHVLCLIFILMMVMTSCNQSEIDNPIKTSLLPLESIQVDSIPLVCRVIISNSELDIHPWYSHEEMCCYFFLPSAASINNVYLIPQDYLIYINGMPITKPINLNQLGYKTQIEGFKATLTGSGKGDLPVKFVKSRNVSTLFINTESGSLDYIHKNKSNSESVNLQIFDNNGNINYISTNLSCTLKGRGHGTWSLKKKPYLLKLPKSVSLLGMPKGKKWVLLANAADETNLRTWIAFKLAESSGLQGTPQCEFIDVYANGNYIGLYFITEKVSPKLVAKEDQEPILVRIDNSVDADSFKTNRGTIMEVDNIGEGAYSIESVKKEMNHFEDLLFSGSWLENVDVDSWAKKYLVDEITENGDAGGRSNYFYYFPGSLYVFGGPIWDYDLSLGRSKYQCGNTNTFIASREWGNPVCWTPHYPLLLGNNIFKKRVIDLFISDFIPVIERLTKTEIKNKYQEISSSIRMNAIRWNDVFTLVRNVHQPVVYTDDELVDFLIKRISFLKSAWIEGKKYHLVQMNYKYGNTPPYPYTCFSVEDGCTFNSSFSIDSPDFVGCHWIDRFTGEDFDPYQIVTQDRQFVFKN